MTDDLFAVDTRPILYCPVCGQQIRVDGLDPDWTPSLDRMRELAARVGRECNRARLNVHGGEVIVA